MASFCGGGIEGQPRLGRSSVNRALDWVDGAAHCLEGEWAGLREVVGRVLADDILTARSIPPCDTAKLDGFAIRAHQTFGASSYNPLSLPLAEVAAGDALPKETDAVIALDQGEPAEADTVNVIEAVAPGDNVDRQGNVITAGAILVSAGTLLGAHHIGILAAAGVNQLPVVRRPNVRIVLAGSRRSRSVEDSNTPMLCALVARDGGAVWEQDSVDRSRSAFAEAVAAGGADAVLVVGGTGPDRDDAAASALAAAGELAIHGVALHPGETTGLGRNSIGVPVVLLPGSPAECLWSYELFAGRLIRRLAGRDSSLPYQSRTMTTNRKIVSSIGMTEICPVRCVLDGAVEPITPFAEIGLMAAVNADGFVIVPEASEGHPPGTALTVYLYPNR